MAKLVPRTHLMTETEWRNLGVIFSRFTSIVCMILILILIIIAGYAISWLGKFPKPCIIFKLHLYIIT